jgi:hypothetical protein
LSFPEFDRPEQRTRIYLFLLDLESRLLLLLGHILVVWRGGSE